MAFLQLRKHSRFISIAICHLKFTFGVEKSDQEVHKRKSVACQGIANTFRDPFANVSCHCADSFLRFLFLSRHYIACVLCACRIAQTHSICRNMENRCSFHAHFIRWKRSVSTYIWREVCTFGGVSVIANCDRFFKCFCMSRHLNICACLYAHLQSLSLLFFLMCLNNLLIWKRHQ